MSQKVHLKGFQRNMKEARNNFPAKFNNKNPWKINIGNHKIHQNN